MLNGSNPKGVSIQVKWIDAIIGFNYLSTKGMSIQVKWIDMTKAKGVTIGFNQRSVIFG